MLTSAEAIRSLEQALAAALASLHIQSTEFGRPADVEKAAKEAEKSFQGIAKSRPSKEDAYHAALAFVRGQTLDERQHDLIASALCEPLREQQGIQVAGHNRLEGLLQKYEMDAKSGHLWRLTWYGLLSSYFSFNPVKANEKEHAGWSRLRDTLRDTWAYIDRDSGTRVVPDWVQVMRKETQVLTDAAADKYAGDYLDGRDETVQQLAEDLGIPQSSWFWHSLVLGAVRKCCSLTDTEFKARIPRLLELLIARPVFRDEALELILVRYHRCSTTEVHRQLCDFVVDKDVWRNPKLKDAGIATAWNRVPEPVWTMMRKWVNEESLRLFFQLLAGRSGSDEGRLAFWSRYLDQIHWTRLVFGAETVDLARRKPEIRALLAQEDGSYATLIGNKDVDAFMMQLGNYVIVEFSKTGNACNVYPAQELQFEPYARSYSGGTDDLKYGYHGGAAIRISHREGWAERAEADLKKIGIYPDKAKPTRRQLSQNANASNSQNNGASSSNKTAFYGSTESPNLSKFSMHELHTMVAKFPSAYVSDLRKVKGGRLWVEDPRQDSALGKTLQSWGFMWANKRNAWYYPEN